MNATDLPARLAETREDFLALGVKDRLQLLLEFSNELPELPERYRDHPDLLEKVEECQSPVYIFVEVVDGRVHLHATAPAEAVPRKVSGAATTRTGIVSPSVNRPVVLLSNRGPVSFTVQPDGSLQGRRGAGGLVSGLAPLVEGTDAVWIAAALSDGDRAAAAGGVVEAHDLRVQLLDIEPTTFAASACDLRPMRER